MASTVSASTDVHDVRVCGDVRADWLPQPRDEDKAADIAFDAAADEYAERCER